MSEVINYLTILRKRGIRISIKEIRSRLIRENPKEAVKRIMDVCEKHNAIFTFYIVGNSAIVNKDIVREIMERGHEIGCHGYNHLCFDLLSDELIIKDLETAVKVFDKKFSYRLRGFRAPYLAMNNNVANCLMKIGFTYSSSTARKKPFTYQSGISEWPITVCDWYTLIRNERVPEMLYKEMIDNSKDGNVYELHPWRCGQKKYIWVLDEFLKLNKVPCVSNYELSQTGKGIALTGDIGELSLYEIFLRSVLKYGTNYNNALKSI